MKHYSEVQIKQWRLPNIRKIKVINYKWDVFLNSYGILKKIRTLLFTPSKLNNKNNKYLAHCQKILIKQIGIYSENKVYIRNHKASRQINYGYWILARKILLTNRSFVIKHLLKLDSKLGREMKLASIRELLKKAYVKLQKGSLKIDLRRKWIQAPAPKCRSLTIPSLIDRLISSMWTEVLELYLKGTIGPSHHGYQQNKGCSTALKDLFSKQGKYGYVYEFDLENFFPSVQHSILYKLLYSIGIPVFMIQYFLLPLQNKPKLDLELEVPDYVTKQESKIFSSVFEKINYKGESNYVLDKKSNIGVPMGLGYSPLLASLMLIEILTAWKSVDNDYVTYADDGILMTNDASDILRFKDLCEKFGLKVNENKSKFIRKEGGEFSSFKFLGIVYHNENFISSMTRKGYSVDLYNDVNRILVSGYFSTFLARLYGSPEDITQSFHLWWNQNTILNKVLGYFQEYNLLELRKSSVLNSVLNSNLVCTIQTHFAVGIFKEFSTSAIRQGRFKFSGAEYEEFSRLEDDLSVFNHSTLTSHFLVEEYNSIINYSRREVYQTCSELSELYASEWKIKEQLISEELENTTHLLTPQGKIYEYQIGRENFKMLEKAFAGDYFKMDEGGSNRN